MHPSTALRRRPDRAGDLETVRAVLDAALLVHVGTVRDGWPVVLPMAHGRLGDTLVLHGSAAAGLFRDVRRGSPVCVTATVVDGLVLARSATHHSMNYRSCVVFGEARAAEDKASALAAVVDHNLPGRRAQLRPDGARELEETGVWLLDLTSASTSAKVRSGGPVDEPQDVDLPVWAGVVPLTTVAGVPEAAPGGTGPAPVVRTV